MQVEYLKACYSSGYRYPSYSSGYTTGYPTYITGYTSGYNTGYPTYNTGYNVLPTSGYNVLPTSSGYAYNPYATNVNIRYPY